MPQGLRGSAVGGAYARLRRRCELRRAGPHGPALRNEAYQRATDAKAWRAVAAIFDRRSAGVTAGRVKAARVSVRRAQQPDMPRTILMGDPTHFSVLGGANPHTRDILGRKKKVDADLARHQWHNLARALIAHGVDVYVIEPQPRLTGLVYPANAGFLYPLTFEGPEITAESESKSFYLANLLPTRAGERQIYAPFINAMGYGTIEIKARFEGEADFFPAGRFMLFTYGRIERQRFVFQMGMPPWRRIYGFRSERGALDELQAIVKSRRIIALELCLEAYYHGDTVLCSFGPEREFLLAYLEGLTAPSRERLRQEFGTNLIALSERDAALYAANSFQVDHDDKLYLFMPEGVSNELVNEVRQHSVEPVLTNVSEFLAKGGGSIKCMILDLGPSSEQPKTSEAVKFRAEHAYQRNYEAAL